MGCGWLMMAAMDSGCRRAPNTLYRARVLIMFHSFITTAKAIKRSAVSKQDSVAVLELLHNVSAGQGRILTGYCFN